VRPVRTPGTEEGEDGLWVSWVGREGRSGEPSDLTAFGFQPSPRSSRDTYKALETENGVIGPERLMDSYAVMTSQSEETADFA